MLVCLKAHWRTAYLLYCAISLSFSVVWHFGSRYFYSILQLLLLLLLFLSPVSAVCEATEGKWACLCPSQSLRRTTMLPRGAVTTCHVLVLVLCLSAAEDFDWTKNERGSFYYGTFPSGNVPLIGRPLNDSKGALGDRDWGLPGPLPSPPSLYLHYCRIKLQLRWLAIYWVLRISLPAVWGKHN